MIELREYQDEISTRGAEMLRKHHMCYLAMECRTGKTLTAFACAEKYGAKSVLMLSKIKALASIYSDYELMHPSFELDAINYESAHKVSGHYDLVILDESHLLGAFPKPSKRTKDVKTLCNRKPVIYMSGTPSPESYSQLYHQFWVSSYSPFSAYGNFYKWAKVYVNITQKNINGYRINDYSDADKERIDKACSHLFIDWTQKEAGFTSHIEEHVLTCPMSQWTRTALHMIERERILRWNDTVVLGDTPAKLLSKMHQLSSGTVIDEDGNHVMTDTSKALFIREYFKGKKKAIFYIYQSELDMLSRVFPDWTASPEEFQMSETKVFLGQVRSAREGIRLDTADALVFYNIEYSYLSYEQGRQRLSSKERETPALIYFVCSDCGIEQMIMQAVGEKKDFTLSYYREKMYKNKIF